MIEVRWDAIVVAARSSGCVVATRLSDRHDRRVLLLEAGPDYRVGDAPPEMRRGHWTRIMDRARFPQFQWPALVARRGRARDRNEAASRRRSLNHSREPAREP